MGRKRPTHVVHSRQRVLLTRLATPGHGKYGFRPSGQGRAGVRPISRNPQTRFEQECLARGFRSSARTLIVERLGVESDVVEAKLSP